MNYKNYLKRINSSSKGFTLVELLVAISVFVAAVTSISAIYIAIIRSQQKSNIQRLTQQDARYAIETITREVRMATGGIRDGVNYPAIYVLNNQNNQTLVITTTNYENGQVEQKTFKLENGQITVNGDPITSNKLKVTEFKLENYLSDDDYNPTTKIPKRQPSLTITVTTEQKDQNIPAYRRAKTTLRTTISSRDYRYQE